MSRSGAESGDRFTIAGKPVKCPHCGHGEFHRGNALLNTVGMTFFNLDWANKSATTLACTSCGRIEWFVESPDVMG